MHSTYVHNISKSHISIAIYWKKYGRTYVQSTTHAGTRKLPKPKRVLPTYHSQIDYGSYIYNPIIIITQRTRIITTTQKEEGWGMEGGSRQLFSMFSFARDSHIPICVR